MDGKIMKTPWSGLLKHGTAIAVVVVVSISGLILMTVVGITIVLTKLLVLIR
jgi:hypothetical protein